MIHYKDLFVDLDDTVYDTRGNAQLALEEVYTHFHLERYFVHPEDFYVPYWQINDTLWTQYAKGEINRDFLIVERFRQPLSLGKGLNPTVDFCLQVSDFFLDCNACKPGVVEDAHEVLAYLREKGYRMHICSNGFHEVQYRKLESSKLMCYFDTVVLAEDAGFSKPSPYFFDYSVRITGADPHATLMIGDNPDTDIVGALLYGIDAMYFERRNVKTDFPRSVNYVIHRLREIRDIL